MEKKLIEPATNRDWANSYKVEYILSFVYAAVLYGMSIYSCAKHNSVVWEIILFYALGTVMIYRGFKEKDICEEYERKAFVDETLDL
jgi:putative Mn2+ efflux pump MntP